jgi:DNA-binding transcriptional ArsR family regulator
MNDTPEISATAALLADPTRGRMLSALMQGRALTATELALEGGVSASTASSHLARLTGAGLVAIARQGRHRYYELASAEVASAIEGLMTIAVRGSARVLRPGPRDEALRRARVCYDHLAGETAVRMLDRMRERKLVVVARDAIELTSAGEAWCRRVGIDLETLGATRRRLCRPCLDWSERRTHLAGALGAALLERLFALRYARRVRDSRVVVLSPRGEAFVERLEL